MDIGFIGLGVMGGPMAANLARAGYSLKVYDLDPEKCARIADLGAAVANSPSDAATNVDYVMTSLPGPKQIQDIAFGENGIVEKMRPGATWIELSTNNLEVGAKILRATKDRGLCLLDAPISGGSEGASDGTLTILVGSDGEAFRRCLPILRTIGERIDYLGPNGAGYAAKIAQVVLCYIHSLALSEAMMLGVKGGVPADKMLEIIQNSTGTSYVAHRYGPLILDGDYDSSFTLALALKDLRLARELAASVTADLPLCNLVQDTYERACGTFGGEANHLMAVKILEDAHQTLLRGTHQTAPPN
ncbi:MAG: NAD(P)-dependent oxidoreductase [Pseudomonadota bacterium]